MMRRSSIFLFLVVLVVSFPALVGAGRSRPAKPVFVLPKSVKDLQNRALQALADGDAKALMRLMVTPDDALKYCPSKSQGVDPILIQQTYDRLRQHIKKVAAQCAKLFDWKRAVIVEVKGGVVGKSPSRCNGNVAKVRDVKVIYSVGGRRFRVKLDDPVRLGKKSYVYKLSDDPRCSEIHP